METYHANQRFGGAGVEEKGKAASVTKAVEAMVENQEFLDIDTYQE